MFNKILIANRGEIAVRIIRACKELGERTVAVFSEEDRDALHTRLADGALCIGPANSADSYLNVSSIISAVEVADAGALHPGYGFLSENAAFAEVCENSGVKFIGPTSHIIRLMGNKVSAKKEAERAGVPVLPWSEKPIEDEKEALEVSKKIGFPLIIKASNGGGGRGMKLVHTQASLGSSFHLARREAKSIFGDDEVFLEKYCIKPRHIEIQIMADEYGNVIHLGERECSIQRRHQKILEEAPSSFVDAKLREKMGDASVKLCKAIGYVGVGTIEYLVDEDKNFYFMEMNTRVQVEHPVTEEITGIDILKEQIRLAAGRKLPMKQKEVRFTGHSIECRINAEDPRTYVPSPGKITELYVPGGPGVRVDTAIYCNYKVPPHYDPMIAKLIVYAKTRRGAIRKMTSALEEFHIEGIKTNIPLHLDIMKDHDYIAGDVAIDFLSRFS
ncbi:Biotin carboxylase of acetyl-CoA carboxylase [hydrothermal vent metagenome]|uniref:Biotin carboxylase of acetyl-CoA carboxylase n=1 Tax=hydrothermal vent metagenome TaxID=652676 RepID=A0A3B0QLE0_9ZZZZ